MREDWEKCILDDLLVFMTNGSSAKQFDEEVGLPISRIETIWDEKIDFSRVKYIKESVPEFIEKYRICKNDILLSHINSDSHLGKTAIYKNDKKVFIHGINLLKLRPTPRINADFLIHQFRFKKIKGDFIAVAQRAVNQSSINQRKLKVFDFILPSLSEQRAIVAKIEELFSDLDKGITDLKKAQDQLVTFRQAVLKKAFEGELTKEWREQQTDLPKADELLMQIKEERQKHYEQLLENWKQALKSWEENGKEGKKPTKPKKLIEISNLTKEELDKLDSLPSEWLYSYLAFAGELARGKSKHRPRNDSKLFENGKYPFIQTGDVKAQKIITDFNKKYSEFGLQQSKLWKKGTLCITIAANIAETGFLGIDACFPDSIVGFTPFNEIIENHFIEYFFQLAKTRISAYAPATAQKNINLTILENLVVPFCSKKEQNKIVQEIESRLSVCDNVELSIVESLEKAKALRQSILKKAFDGTLLSVAEIAACKAAKDYEPASVLLEKIKAEKKKP
jgi:type I restriction enzyme S subunit